MGARAARLDIPGDRETIRTRATVAALHLVRQLVTET
jgi:nicotinamide mononucleotide (NMN) deamidase PncC